MAKLSNDEITKLVLIESKKLQKIINEHFLPKFAQLHNIDPEHNFFDAKQEIIARKAYFPGVKKKYCLQLSNMEGIPVDEQEVRGLITRRSDYPSITKKRIKQLLDLLVKEDVVSFSAIRELIKENREELLILIRNGDKQASRPVSFTKPLDEYKVRPMHIKGMLLWNSLEYEYFVPGTRGYLFRIKAVDPYNSPDAVKKKLTGLEVGNAICLPGEEISLPDYYKLDVDAMISFAWDDRINELITPIQSRINPARIREEAALLW